MLMLEFILFFRYCRDNPDVNFNSCEIDQEFSDKEIDDMMNAQMVRNLAWYIDYVVPNIHCLNYAALFLQILIL